MRRLNFNHLVDVVGGVSWVSKFGKLRQRRQCRKNIVSHNEMLLINAEILFNRGVSTDKPNNKFLLYSVPKEEEEEVNDRVWSVRINP